MGQEFRDFFFRGSVFLMSQRSMQVEQDRLERHSLTRFLIVGHTNMVLKDLRTVNNS